MPSTLHDQARKSLMYLFCGAGVGLLMQAQLTHKLRMAQEETRRLREVVEAQQAPRTPECLSTHPLHPEPDSHVSIVLRVVDADEECEKLVEKVHVCICC